MVRIEINEQEVTLLNEVLPILKSRLKNPRNQEAIQKLQDKLLKAKSDLFVDTILKKGITI